MNKPIEALILAAQSELFGWVPVERYQQMFPEENRERIRGRIRRGVWVEGTHFQRAGERDMWVHLRNIKAWLERRAVEEDPLVLAGEADQASLQESEPDEPDPSDEAAW